ncbi:tetraacyldisaccharide 4'-kinase [Desulfosarcina sp.]|uniref:tetraacyldisaccharide 4'-kinase n=1 Tax=Desulfosarcina sp. TaxID=2027861 RepID=UPI0035629A8B
MTRLKKIIQRFERRVEMAAKGEDPTPFISIETVLRVLSVVYGGLMCLRARLYETGVLTSKRLPCRVLSIGNLVAGGTGKTPMTILVARMIRDMGCRVVVLSRGYGGRMEKMGGIVSDGRTIFKGPEDAGDEPYLMARILRGIPVTVGRRRYDAGMMAVKRFKPDVIVLDDAFQHLRLKRDFNLVLLDSRSPFGNGHLLPRGLLREPLSALRRAHAVVYTRSEQALNRPIRDRWITHQPMFYATHHPIVRKVDQTDRLLADDALDIGMLKGKKAVAFSGLADNAQFFDSLEQAGCALVHTFSFADHYHYDASDLDRIAAAAKKKGADVLVTSLKDAVKIENVKQWPVALVVVDVIIKLAKNDVFFKTLSDVLVSKPT